jgi:hypothetical protein
MRRLETQNDLVSAHVYPSFSASVVVLVIRISLEHLGKLHHPMQEANECAPILPAHSGNLAFGDALFEWIPQLLENRRHFLIDILRNW